MISFRCSAVPSSRGLALLTCGLASFLFLGCQGSAEETAESLSVSASQVRQDDPPAAGDAGIEAPAGVVGAVPGTVADPGVLVVYSASSRGYLEPCGCEVQGTEMGGIARRATVVDSLRATGAPVLLVEAGDFVGGGGEPGLQIGGTTLRIMKAMGYDALALGEAELALGEVFLKTVASSGVPLAHANWSHPAVGAAQKEGLLLEKEGLKIGLIGLLDPATLPADLPLEGLVVDPPLDAVVMAVTTLRRAGADLIVVLGHASYRSSGLMAGAGGEELPFEVDLWVVGHGGKELSEPTPVGNSLLLGSGNGGKLVGILALEMDARAQGEAAKTAPAHPPAREFANTLYPLHLTVREKPSIAALVKAVDPTIRHNPGPTLEASPS